MKIGMKGLWEGRKGKGGVKWVGRGCREIGKGRDIKA